MKSQNNSCEGEIEDFVGTHLFAAVCDTSIALPTGFRWPHAGCSVRLRGRKNLKLQNLHIRQPLTNCVLVHLVCCMTQPRPWTGVDKEGSEPRAGGEVVEGRPEDHRIADSNWCHSRVSGGTLHAPVSRLYVSGHGARPSTGD